MAKDFDFIGFQFGDIHTRDMHIDRVSDGARYNDTVLPTFQDKTANITGSDGTLYWESFYTQKPIPIKVAFDTMTEQDYRKFRQVFNGTSYEKLVFDESPYKYYYAKVQNPPQLNTICFEENGTRIYKGEGTINFICYYPYAKSVHKFLNEYADTDYPNKSQWAAATGMKTTSTGYDGTNATTINLYNPGDKETDFRLYIKFTDVNGTTVPTTRLPLELASLVLSQNNVDIAALEFNDILPQGNDVYLRINSRTNLIEGCDINKHPTGTLYNQYIKAGDFFHIPLGESSLTTGDIYMDSIDYEYIYY